MNKKPKEDCKYWDKCYQKNEHHLKTYNHPNLVEEKTDNTPKSSDEEKGVDLVVATETPQNIVSVIDGAGEDVPENNEKVESSKKRKSSEAVADDNAVSVPKKNNTKRLWDQSEINSEEKEESFSFIHEKFLVKMPKDFYMFWKFVCGYRKEANKASFKSFNADLVGPFDFLAGKFASVENKSPGDFLRHWRFYYDPPEFQTLFVKRGTGIHYGYWRDDPKDEENLLIVRNDPSKGCVFELVATNMFDAFAYYLEKDYSVTPFNHKDLSNIRKAISVFVQENKFERKSLFEVKAERAKKICAKTFHNVGIVVPVNKSTTVGYRPLIESDANIKKILSAFDKAETGSKEAVKEIVMEKLQPIITAAVIALDECDFGSNLELGMDLFCSGHKELHEIVQNLLNPAYKLLGRPQYMAILKAHLADRRDNYKLSILK